MEKAGTGMDASSNNKKDKRMISLDELIEAAQNPTPEIVEEVSKRVHKVKELCVHNWKFKSRGSYDHWRCTRRGCREYPTELERAQNQENYRRDYLPDIGEWTHYKFEQTERYGKKPVSVPDYTKPENFWALLWEIISMPEMTVEISRFCFSCSRGTGIPGTGRGYQKDFVFSFPCPDKQDLTGLAVGLAYLKIKEQKNE